MGRSPWLVQTELYYRLDVVSLGKEIERYDIVEFVPVFNEDPEIAGKRSWIAGHVRDRLGGDAGDVMDRLGGAGSRGVEND